MKTKLFIFAATLIFTIISCRQEDCCDDADVYSTSFVRGYLFPDSIKFWNANDTNTMKENKYYKTSVGLEFTGKMLFDNIEHLSKKYNDTSFNNYCYPRGNKAISCIIDSIKVFSDNDYDSLHPKGHSLNDIATIRFNTFADFIDNGYKKNPQFDMIGGISYRREKLSDYFKSLGRLWIVCPFYIYFTQTPTEHKTHNLTFKFYLDDGRVLCATTEYTFE